MAKFRFRLATLLKIRRATRDARYAELGQAYQAATTLAEHRQAVQEKLRAHQRAVRRAASPGTINLERMIQAQRYHAVLKTEAQLLTSQTQLLEGEIERRREAVAAADRDVRVLEKLRDRQWQRHQQEVWKEDIKQLDEVATRGGQPQP